MVEALVTARLPLILLWRVLICRLADFFIKSASALLPSVIPCR